MSATFSAPATATGGLQAYDLDPRVKNLAPETGVIFRRLRQAAARRRLRRGIMRKDHTTMSDTIKSMVGTLGKSVSDIIAAGTDDRDALLTKSFGEFETALQAELQKVADGMVADAMQKRGPVEEPLFKGLGTVSRVANLVSMLSSKIACIQDGKDYPGQTKDADADDDSASDEVMSLLEQSLHAAELAMRQAVNEHVDVADEKDTDASVGEGVHLLVVKSADGADLRVKTKLPPELAKYATDPALIEADLLEGAIGTLLDSGVEEAALSKLFEPEAGAGAGGKPALAKDAAGAGGDGGGDGAGNGASGGADDGGAADDQDPIEMLHVAGRLAAALLIQLNGVLNVVEGSDGGDDAGGGDGAGDGGAAAGGGAGAGGGGGANTEGGTAPGTKLASGGGQTTGTEGGTEDDPNKKKPPFGKSADPEVIELRKMIDEQQKTVTALNDRLAKVLAHPEAPKAILAAGGGTGPLAKTADSAAGDGALSDTEIATRLEKIADNNKKAEALTKMTYGQSPKRVLESYGV